jgi:hypothetical protein
MRTVLLLVMAPTHPALAERLNRARTQADSLPAGQHTPPLAHRRH